MSGYGYKRTFTHTVIYVRFTPESRPFSSLAFMSANDPKRTLRRAALDVRKRPEPVIPATRASAFLRGSEPSVPDSNKDVS